MNLRALNDQALLSATQSLVSNERVTLTHVLRHLKEIEYRRLYSSLGYSSLFSYAVKELKYSEGQAGRRIQAMRLIKEIPQVETKIATGDLSLSNAASAQSLFKNISKHEPEAALNKQEKLDVLNLLKDKSTREGQRVLLDLQPNQAIPKETEKPVTSSATQVRFVMDDDLKEEFAKVRSLLGAKGAEMNYAELFLAMAKLAGEKLEEKRFGKRRVAVARKTREEIDETKIDLSASKVDRTPAQEFKENVKLVHSRKKKGMARAKSDFLQSSTYRRYLSKSLRHQVWQRDQGRCQQCQSQRNLNFDHITPVALGGMSTLENLRLLCFSCNQRAAMDSFGVDKMRGYRSVNR